MNFATSWLLFVIWSLKTAAAAMKSAEEAIAVAIAGTRPEAGHYQARVKQGHLSAASWAYLFPREKSNTCPSAA